MDNYEFAHEGVIFFNKRRTGNTTRIIDNVIQLLFRGVEVAMYENDCTSYEKSKRMAEQVMARLKLEHPHDAKHVKTIRDKRSHIVCLKLEYPKNY